MGLRNLVSVSAVSQAYGDARDSDMSVSLVSNRLNKADCRGDHLGVVASIDLATNVDMYQRH